MVSGTGAWLLVGSTARQAPITEASEAQMIIEKICGCILSNQSLLTTSS